MNTFVVLRILGRSGSTFPTPIDMRINTNDIKRYYFDTEAKNVRVLLTCIGHSKDAGMDVAFYIVDSSIEELDAIILSNNGPSAKILFGKKE